MNIRLILIHFDSIFYIFNILQYLQNVHYFTKIRDRTKCVIFLFSTELNNHVKDIYI